MDLCRLNVSQCLNNGICTVNDLLNTTSCLCGPCHEGNFCENIIRRQKTYNTKYVFLYLYCFGWFISLLNNCMSLELFIRCRAIRRTNCGVYLIIYSTLALLASTLLVADGVVEYDINTFGGSPYARDTFHCVVGVAGYNTAVFLCIWFSASIQLEQGLIAYRGATKNSTRTKSIIVSALLLAMGIGCSIPIAFYRCDWDHMPGLKAARVFLMYFHIAIPIIIYIIATVLSLIGFARRIRAYGMEMRSYKKTFAKLAYSHLFIFIPPFVYAICYGPFNLVASQSKAGMAYYQCGISLGEYIIKVLLRATMGLPFVITWLIFVYPSRVYMNEFYMNTWCGQWTAWIVLGFQRCCSKKRDA